MNDFFNKDITSIKDYTRDQLEKIFEYTDKIIALDPIQRREICKGKTLSYLFYEPSTRTR
ncbi:MAG: aspartate carbamoyltransferase, partial [Nitrosopumilaceae archaeon]